jgi:hypothetical protein
MKKLNPYLIMAGVIVGVLVALSFVRPYVKNIPLLNRI